MRRRFHTPVRHCQPLANAERGALWPDTRLCNRLARILERRPCAVPSRGRAPTPTHFVRMPQTGRSRPAAPFVRMPQNGRSRPAIPFARTPQNGRRLRAPHRVATRR
jgi:hypothetical protein